MSCLYSHVTRGRIWQDKVGCWCCCCWNRSSVLCVKITGCLMHFHSLLWKQGNSHNVTFSYWTISKCWPKFLTDLNITRCDSKNAHNSHHCNLSAATYTLAVCISIQLVCSLSSIIMLANVRDYEFSRCSLAVASVFLHSLAPDVFFCTFLSFLLNFNSWKVYTFLLVWIFSTFTSVFIFDEVSNCSSSLILMALFYIITCSFFFFLPVYKLYQYPSRGAFAVFRWICGVSGLKQ